MRSLKSKLLLSFLPLCLVPLVGISLFSYWVAEETITEDRIVLYVEQIARDVASTIRLTLLEKHEETRAMALYGEFRDYLVRRAAPSPRCSSIGCWLFTRSTMCWCCLTPKAESY